MARRSIRYVIYGTPVHRGRYPVDASRSGSWEIFDMLQLDSREEISDDSSEEIHTRLWLSAISRRTKLTLRVSVYL